MKHNQYLERGFILVTSLVLMAILTMLGAVAFFKTNVEVKVSAGSVNAEQAYSAMRAGTHKIYTYWSSTGSTEFDNLGKWVAKKNGSAPSVYVNSYPDTVSDLAVSGVVSPPAGARVYTFTSTGGMTTGTAWSDAVNDPQVAIWVASYTPKTGAVYPYSEPTHVTAAATSGGTAPALSTTTGTACSDCALVLYSLGRAGTTRRLAREYMSTTNSVIEGFGAMTNAPKYTDDTNWCTDEPNPDTGSSCTTDLSGSITTTHFIDATQAPGGLAIASNNCVDAASGNKPWSGNLGSGSAFKDVDMYVVYDPGKVDHSDYPTVIGGQMSALAATVVSADRAADPSTYIDYFASADSQLFQLDAYREGANYISGFADETFNYVDENGIPQSYTTNTGGTKLGNAGTLSTNNANHGRTGTLQWEDVYYNIINAKPMYGLVRMMLPARVTSGSNGVDTNRDGFYDVDDVTETPDTMPSCTTVMEFVLGSGPSGEVVDPLGNGHGKLIVYGAGLFDFFWDKNNNGVYEPDLGGAFGNERVLTPKEALSLAVNDKVNVDIPLMFNPVMDGLAMNTTETRGVGHADYAGVELLEIGSYPTESPSWDLASDELLAGDGSMDLIYDVWQLGRTYLTSIHDGTNYVLGDPAGGTDFASFNFKNWMDVKPTWPFTAWTTPWISDEEIDLRSLMDYYIRTTALASKNDWSHSTVSSIESNYDTFNIDTPADLEHSDGSTIPASTDTTQSHPIGGDRALKSAADLFHAFLPSGYIHGWKRAMEVTGLAAQSGSGDNKTIWSEKLIASDSQFFATKTQYFNVTRNEATGKAYIDEKFADMPAQMYAGGLVDQHQEVNISGVVYTPGMLELEQKQQVYDGWAAFSGGQTNADRNALQYINGLVITGHGVFMKAAGTTAAKTVIAYDTTSIDNLPTLNDTIITGRKYWQELK